MRSRRTTTASRPEGTARAANELRSSFTPGAEGAAGTHMGELGSAHHMGSSLGVFDASSQLREAV
jgi:hypothetical protein